MRLLVAVSAVVLFSAASCPGVSSNGTNTTGGSTNPPPSKPVAAIAISGHSDSDPRSVCAIIKQKLHCWQADKDAIKKTVDDEGVFNGPFVAVAISDDGTFACGVQINEKVVCWKGRADKGRFAILIGFETAQFSSLSLRANPSGGLLKMLCGIRVNDGAAQCGFPVSALGPAPDKAFANLWAGGKFACASDSLGKVTCFEQGTQTLADYSEIQGKVIQIALNRDDNNPAFALLESGKVVNWSNKSWAKAIPTEKFSLLSLGGSLGSEICGTLLSDGKVICWAPSDMPEFKDSLTNGNYRSISTTAGEFCALTTANDAVCWKTPDAGFAKKGIPPEIAGE